ncbi:MAG: TolC family protein, partial [Cytophagales bacterium]|nr:TolC family protein [Cytophagales bacterium]
AKRYEVQGGQFGIDAAKWQYYPTPSLLTERAANETYKSFGVTTSSTLRIEQPLWSGGRLDAAAQSAAIKHEAARISVEETQWGIALHTLDAWQNLRLAQGRERAGAALILQLQNLSAMMERRVAQQVSPAIDAQLLQARLAQAKSDQRLAEAAIAAAKARLVQWAGEAALAAVAASSYTSPSTSTVPPADKRLHSFASRQGAAVDVAMSATRDAAIHADVARTPSLMRYEQEIRLAQQDIRLKQADQWPSVYARLDRQLSDYGSLGTKTAINTLYLGLQYSPGAGLAVRSEVLALGARLQSLESDRDTLIRQIKDTIASEWRDYEASSERIQMAMEVQSGNAELFESYTRLFVAGKRSWLELLNTLREQNSADIQLSDLAAQQEASYFRLRLYRADLAWQNKNQTLQDKP